MKVTLTKHGGLAAGMRQLPVSVNSSTLAVAEREKLEQLVTAAASSSPKQEGTPREMRDGMSYTITVDANDKTTTFRQADLNMTGEFEALMNWMENRFKSTNSQSSI